MQNEIIASAVKAAPPVTVSAGVAIFGIELPDAVLILTGIYTILQTIFLIRDKLFGKTKVDGDES